MGDSGWLGAWLPKALLKPFTPTATKRKRASSPERSGEDVSVRGAAQRAIPTPLSGSGAQPKRQKLGEAQGSSQRHLRRDHSLTLLQRQQDARAPPVQGMVHSNGDGLVIQKVSSDAGYKSRGPRAFVSSSSGGLRTTVSEPQGHCSAGHFASAAKTVHLPSTRETEAVQLMAAEQENHVFPQLLTLSASAIPADTGNCRARTKPPEGIKGSSVVSRIAGTEPLLPTALRKSQAPLHPGEMFATRPQSGLKELSCQRKNSTASLASATACVPYTSSTSALPVLQKQIVPGSLKSHSTSDLVLPTVVTRRARTDVAVSALKQKGTVRFTKQEQIPDLIVSSRRKVESASSTCSSVGASLNASNARSLSVRAALPQSNNSLSRDSQQALYDEATVQCHRAFSMPLSSGRYLPSSQPVASKSTEVHGESSLFSSPIKRPAGAVESLETVIFGHRILRPLVSKLPQENFDAFIEIHKHAKMHCEAETVELLIRDKELIYYTRGNHHPSLTQQHQHVHGQPHSVGCSGSSARPAWAHKGALVASLEAQKTVDPFSVFGDAPPELVLHEIYGREHYNALGPRTRATHPVLRKFERYFRGVITSLDAGSSSCLEHSAPRTAATLDGPITEELWSTTLIPALRSWWRSDTSVELDWRHDPLTTEDCAWYIQALGAWEDMTDIVTIKQPCFCPTPPPQKDWTWMDSRQALRRSLAAGTTLMQQSASSKVNFARVESRVPHTAIFASAGVGKNTTRRTPITFALEASSPVTPGIRANRHRPWAKRQCKTSLCAHSKHQLISRLEKPTKELCTVAKKMPNSLTTELHKLLGAAQLRLDNLAKRARIANERVLSRRSQEFSHIAGGSARSGSTESRRRELPQNVIVPTGDGTVSKDQRTLKLTEITRQQNTTYYSSSNLPLLGRCVNIRDNV